MPVDKSILSNTRFDWPAANEAYISQPVIMTCEEARKTQRFCYWSKNMLRFIVLASLVACSFGATPRFRRPRLHGRIVGGGPVDIADYPYQLSFEYATSHKCGASIISASWVVTAAQCVDGVTASRVQFRAGSSTRGSGGSIHPASQIIAHPQYDYYTFDYDIAVVRVSVSFTYGERLQPIPVATDEPSAGQTAVATGWGTVSSGSSSLSSQLQAVVIQIVSREECNEAYAAYGGITENMICAAVIGGGKDACQGDTGGPLVVDGALVGVVSWGVGCAEENYPRVYSNVARLRDFITEETGVS